MALIRDGRLVEDPWTAVADGAPLPAAGPVVIGLARWSDEREALIARGQPLGLRLENDQSPALIGDDLAHFDLVVLSFPKFTDGRAYSQARTLRERYRFTGEIRATGQVLRDQLALMQRCGFDGFEIADETAAKSWARAADEISVRYQPAADGRAWASELRGRVVARSVA